MLQPTTIERAFELARSGRFEKLEHLESQLSREGHSAVYEHLRGAHIRRQLRELLKQSRAAEAASLESAGA